MLDDSRKALQACAFPAEDVLLPGYLENEEGVTVGAIVSAEQKVYEFEHHDAQGDTLARFEETSDPQSIATNIGAIFVAIDTAGVRQSILP